MKFRNGLLVAGSLAFLAAGCAGGGSGAGGGALPPGVPLPEPTPSEAGERPREDQFTRAAQDFLDDGFAQETLGQLDAAAVAFQQAVAQAEQAASADPTNPRAQILLGEAAVEVGDYTLAGDAYARALELRPAYLEEMRSFREQQWVRLYNEGIPFINAGEYAEAIEILGAADRIYGDRPEIKVILGQLYAQEQEYELAIESMEGARAIIEGPRIMEVDSATAADWIDGAEPIDPTIAQSLLQLERWAEAVPVLESLVEERPGELPYVFSLADALRELGRTADAISLYNDVAAQSGLEAQEYLQLGIGLYQADEYLDAAQAFMRAAEVAPYDRDALELGVNSLQLTYVQNEEVEAPADEVEAWVDMAQRWIDLDPSNPRAYTALAQGLSRQGDTSRAPDLLNTAEALPFGVRDLQMTRTRSGANILGYVSRLSDDAPSNVTLLFTFYDASGNVLGTETTTVALPAGEGASASLNIDFEGEAVEGYGYSVQN